MRIFVDFGYGYLKSITDDNRSVIFPSVAGELQESSFALQSSNGLGITTEEGSWLFGQSALRQSSLTTRWQESTWLLRPEYRAGILTAITELTKASRVDIELMIALPFQDYNNKPLRQELIESLKGEHEVKRLGRGTQRISINFPPAGFGFSAVPQNIAPAFCHLLDKKGHFVFPSRDRKDIYIGVLNVGSHTVELGTASIELPNYFSGIAAQSRTEAKGMYTLSRAVRPKLQELFLGERSKFDDHTIFDCLRTGRITLYNQEEDVSKITDNLKEQYCNLIAGICSANWSDESPVPKSELYQFVVSGGGAHVVAPYLRDWHPNVVVSDDPQYDVVEGMRRLRRMLG